jgi:hypothetical protein
LIKTAADIGARCYVPALSRFADQPVKTTIRRSELALFDYPLLLGLIILALCTEL